MEKIYSLTQTEMEYIMEVLVKHWLNKDIRRVIRILANVTKKKRGETKTIYQATLERSQ